MNPDPPPSKPGVPRSVWNAVVDALAFAAFVFLVVTGLIMRYSLPPGSGAKVAEHRGAVDVLWGFDRHEWGEIHFWIALALLGILAVHLVLHWRWVVSVVRGKTGGSGLRVGLAVVALVLLLALALSPLFSEIQRTPRNSGLENPQPLSTENVRHKRQHGRD